ncbi:MAG: hypothetical protein ABL962_06970 [Fimbriimonadaceae bacterium]
MADFAVANDDATFADSHEEPVKPWEVLPRHFEVYALGEQIGINAFGTRNVELGKKCLGANSGF